MELTNGYSNKATGLVVLMTEKGSGVVVSRTDNNSGHHPIGHWSRKWHQNLKHSRKSRSSEYWAPFKGTITLEND